METLTEMPDMAINGQVNEKGDEVVVLEEREHPKLPKDAPHVTWLRPRDIFRPQANILKKCN